MVVACDLKKNQAIAGFLVSVLINRRLKATLDFSAFVFRFMIRLYAFT